MSTSTTRYWISLGSLALLLLLTHGALSDTPPPDPYDPAVIDTWTLEQQVGQLLIWGSTNVPEDLTPILEGEGTAPPIPLGGLLLTSNKTRTAASVRTLASFLRTTPATPVPILLCADEEGGLVAALRDEVRVAPSHTALGVLDYESIYRAAEAMGTDAHAAGIDCILGPVLDVDAPPLNPVIGGKERTFSGDPATAATAAVAFTSGLWASGIVPVLKHFPGHGTALADSHKELPQVAATFAEWQATEAVPYDRLLGSWRLNSDPPPVGVMVAHLDWPNLCADEGPTCFSRTLITSTLREGYGLADQVIMSDDLLMRAITDPVEAAIQMRKAGIDLLIVSRNPATLRAIHHALVKFYRNGWLDQDELRASCVRILKLKRYVAAQRTDLTLPAPTAVVPLLGGDPPPPPELPDGIF